MIDLEDAGCAYVDSNVFIYFMEGDAPFKAAAAAVFTSATELKLPLVASEYAFAECLFGAYKKKNAKLADQCRDFFRHSAVDVFAVEPPILEAAAALGPSSGLKLPDAIHVAAALFSECDLFITNDARIRSRPGMRVALLD